MRKVSYYLILVVAAGIVIIAFWVYQRYLVKENPAFLLFPVERGSVQEVVKVRGEVVAQKEFNLEFPFAGTISNIFVSEGEKVAQGDPLMKLETVDFELEIQNLETLLAQRKANFAKLLAGATPEDIKISETKVSNADISLTDAKQALVDKIQDAYTKSDDAVRNKADQIFNNPRSSDPQISFVLSDQQLEGVLESSRLALESTLVSWNNSAGSLSVSGDLDFHISIADKNLDQVKLFLDNAALAVNSLTPNTNLTQTKIDAWKADISAARTNINSAIANISSTQEKLRSADSSLALAENELAFKKAGARIEDIETAKAQIREVESQIAIVREKIRKSVIYAPVAAKVLKVGFEKKEVFNPGQVAISLATFANKIQADVSELEIGKIREADGNTVLIKFDAFPKQEFKGKVVSVEPKEIIKEGDKYYRTNVSLEKPDEAIRNGMSADLEILASLKNNVFKIPALAIYEREGKKFVKILPPGEQKAESSGSLKEVEIETGISDGESVEVISGLGLGQTVVVYSD